MRSFSGGKKHTSSNTLSLSSCDGVLEIGVIEIRESTRNRGEAGML